MDGRTPEVAAELGIPVGTLRSRVFYGLNRDEHRTLRESLGASALGQLGEPERTTLAAHLDGCAACRVELPDIDHLAPPPPPPELGRTDRRPGHVRAADLTAPRRAARGGRGRGGSARRRRGGHVAGSATPVVPRESVILRAADARVDASATVVPHTLGAETTRDADGFTPGAAYRVVVLDDTGRQVDAGGFVGTGSTRMLCNLNSTMLRAQTAGFDVLDPGGAVVLHGEL